MREFLKYVLATIVGMIALSIVGFFLIFAIIGAIVSSAEKQVIVENNSMLMLNLDRQIVDRAPNDPFEDLDMPFFSQAKMVGLDDISTSLKKAVLLSPFSAASSGTSSSANTSSSSSSR